MGFYAQRLPIFDWGTGQIHVDILPPGANSTTTRHNVWISKDFFIAIIIVIHSFIVYQTVPLKHKFKKNHALIHKTSRHATQVRH